MTDSPGGSPSPHDHSSQLEDIKHLGAHEGHSDDDEIRHIGHTAESFEKLAHSIEGMKESTEKRAHEAEENKRRFLKSLKVDAYVIPIITVLGVALSIGASTYWNSKHQQVAHLYSQASEIKEDIDNLFTARNNLMNAMIQTRAVRDIGQTHCQDGKYVGNDRIAYQEKLSLSDFNLVSAAYNTTGIFSNTIDNKISEFISLADIKSICDKNSPKDEELRPLQREVNELILKDIKKLRDFREKILSEAKQ